MPEIWVGLDARARRKNWWWTGLLTLWFGMMAALCLLPQSNMRTVTDRWWWVGVIGTFWLAALFYMTNRGYGKTLLAPDRMQFRTFVSRRSIPWHEVTKIEMHRHQTVRGGSWWQARVHRVNGRPLTIPGAFTNHRHDSAFEEKIGAIHNYWVRTVGSAAETPR